MEKRITGFPVVDDDWKLVNILLNFFVIVYEIEFGVRFSKGMTVLYLLVCVCFYSFRYGCRLVLFRIMTC